MLLIVLHWDIAHLRINGRLLISRANIIHVYVLFYIYTEGSSLIDHQQVSKEGPNDCQKYPESITILGGGGGGGGGDRTRPPCGQTGGHPLTTFSCLYATGGIHSVGITSPYL